MSTDAGTRLTVADVAGKPMRAWDSRGHTILSHYDDLQRPTHLRVAERGGTPKLFQRTVYGESLDAAGPMPTNPQSPSPAQQHNLRGQAYLVFDGAGLLTSDDFDFKGNLKSSTRRLARAYATVADWSTLPRSDPGAPGAPERDEPAAILNAAEGLLEPDDTTAPTRFTTLAAYDALNRITGRTTPDGSVTKPQYNEAGLLEKVVVSVRGGADTTVVHRIDYNEKGQRILCQQGGAAGNPSHITQYDYDKDTFRLTGITTTRNDGTVLQKLGYTYDPVGNIVALRDDSGWEPLFARKPVTAPGHGKYQYDALYRLISAQGREHPGQQPSATDEAPANASDLQALDTYTENYTYDGNGNIQRMRHVGSSGWTRRYRYAYEVHAQDPNVPASNRLAASSLPGDGDDQWSATYVHDEHGSMVRMPHLSSIDWDHADRMQHADLGGGGQSYFTYDAAGQRVRKVWEHHDQTELVEERIYLDGYETYRRRQHSVHDPVEEERQTLHVMDDQRRVLMVETKKVGTSSTTLWRYQLDNHLGSSTLELDQTGKVITYEEYHPYGTTAFHSDTGEVSPKRYRYTGKEKDEETGLYYHGARYYAAWLGRWTAADPAGSADGLNLYRYARNNPLRLADRSGTQSNDPSDSPELSGVGLTVTSGGKVTFGPLAPSSRVGCDELNPLCRGGALGPSPAPFHFDTKLHLEAPFTPGGRSGEGAAVAPAHLAPPSGSDGERGFFSRGGGILLAGAGSLALGLLLLSNPVGWVVGLTAALAIAGGVAGTTTGAIQLGMSYGGQTTAKQDAEFVQAAGTTLSLTSPGSLVGGTLGLVTTGTDEGLRKGALYGGLAEGALSLGMGLSRLKPGPGVFPPPTGEVSTEVFQQLNSAQRKAYEIGQLTLRDSAYQELRALSPLERGGVLMREGYLLKLNPLNLTKTWSTGLTPGARLIGLPLVNATGRGGFSGLLYLHLEINAPALEGGDR